ncbi:GD23825 [Drosophila simulans]|uniref:GD23825 n=1 Tax=Drosophila simulans TaxID=7240 RepID=B4Q3R4_DROSI|nr:GD23825 [Drosophila simulans]
MKCWHNVVRRRKKKPTAAAEGSKEAHGGVAGPRDRDAICQRQQQVDTYTWLTTQAVPLLWLHLLLLVAFAKHAAAATTIATNPEATTTTVSNYTVTTTALSSSTTTTSTGSAPASSSAADKFAGNWAILEDSFRNIVRIGDGNTVTRTSIEQSLVTIHDIATENLGTLCISTLYRPLQVPINSERYESSRQKTDLAASILQEVGIIRHGGLSDALAKGLLTDDFITGARILALNLTNGAVQSYVWWVKGAAAEIQRYDEDGLQIGKKPAGSYPWFDDETSSPTLRSPKFAPSPPNNYYKGWWTYPYFSCSQSRWLVSYSIAIPPIGRHGLRGFISIDIDVSTLRVNQCEAEPYPFGSRRQKMQQLQTHNRLGARRTSFLGNRMGAIDESTINDLQAFHSSHKCHRTSMVCDYRQPSAETPTVTGGKLLTTLTGSSSWTRGSYQCLCRGGFYSLRHPDGFNGTIMEIAWQEQQDNISNYYSEVFKCLPCAPGCDTCTGPEPCLANYHWPFRISLLTISIGCACGTFVLAGYLFRHRRVKVFKVASPIFLMITLIGCAIMYLEMVAIFPYLDTTWCIATKWTRHMGFCITYTSLLMKTWRVSLTYRVKSAHKIKLNDQQLLQWMVPILLVMLIYLGTWTISATPTAEVILDQSQLKFKQCSYNWWDHSLAIGEVFFLAWGIRVCYNVRNAESLYNEARLISYAIYNIALVNIAMVVFHVMLFPNAGPDYKYMLGFVRTQLSTTTTIALVFGPKILRVLKGQGDKWDQKAKVRSITASFSLNGVGLVPEESPDLYQENEELKEQVQKLAHQIEFMKTVHMQMNNRHLKPKPGGYFTITSTSFQAPYSKNTVSTAQTQTGKMKNSQRSVKDCSIEIDRGQGRTTLVDDAIEFNFHLADTEEGMIVQEDERPEQDKEEEALIAQFRRLFAPILDDSLNLYYQLNDLDDTEHVRIHQTVAQMNDLTSSEEETMVTQVNSPSPPPVCVELLLPISSDSSTASSSLYAIHTPSPAHPSGVLLVPQNLESPLLSGSDAITITEQVQLHNPPHHLQLFEDENNTSCSLSSNLTDSKTLDGRTPIVV